MQFLESILEGKNAYEGSGLDAEMLVSILYKRFEEIDYEKASNDVREYILDSKNSEDWSSEHFIDLSKSIVIE